MTPKRIAIAGLILSIGIGTLSAATLEGIAAHLVFPVEIASLVVVTVFIFVWVHHDAKEFGYRLSRPMIGAILICPVIFVPIYTLWSQPKGFRLGALFKLVGFALVLVGVATLATLVALLAS